MKILTPSKVNITDLVPADWRKPKRLNKILYLLHVCYSDEGYTPVHNKTLERVIGPQYASAAKNLLLELGLIQRSKKRYSPGNRSDSFRWAAKLGEPKVIEIKDKIIDAKLESWRDDRAKRFGALRRKEPPE